MSNIATTAMHHRNHRRRARVISFSVLALGLILSIGAFAYRTNQVENSAQDAFDRQSSEVQDALTQNLAPYKTTLDNLANLYHQTNGALTRDDFRKFEEDLSLPTRFPGTFAVVYAERVTPAQLQPLLEQYQALALEDVTIGHPVTVKDEYYLVLGAAPEPTRGNAVGVDLRDIPSVEETMDRARDRGAATIGPNISVSTLEGVPPIASDPRMLALVKPIYATADAPTTLQSRRDDVKAWGALVVYSDVFLETVRGSGRDRLGVELFYGDKPGAQTLFAAQPPSAAGNPKRGQLTKSVTLTIDGSDLTLRTKALVGFTGDSDRREPYLFLAGGVLISLLLFGFVFTLMRSEAHALESVDIATKELREGEERFRGAFDYAPIGMAIIAADGTLSRVNRALCELLDRPEHELLGHTIEDVTHPDFADTEREQRLLLLAGEQDETSPVDKCYIRDDGHMLWAALSMSAVKDETGMPLYLVAKLEDVTARRAAQEQLQHQATHDPLTRMPNRVLFRDRLEHALARRKADTILAVMFLDLDGFKNVNDTLGHAAGDQLLKTVAERLRAATRTGDTVSRFGGDEFTVLCEEVDSLDTAVQLANRLADAVRRPMAINGERVQVDVSIGLALARPGEGMEALMSHADSALYLAKEHGRACIEIFDPATARQAELLDKSR